MPKGQLHSLRNAQQRLFLQAFAQHGNITQACRDTGTNQSLVYKWKATDPGFLESYTLAEQQAVDVLEEEVRRRAVEGVVRKKFTAQGEPIVDPETGTQYVERQFSDRLLLSLLSARAPQRWGNTLKGDLNLSGKVEIIYAPSLRTLPAKEGGT